ncbi:MAG: ankyrin repeat protein [Rickettsiaceae bacterium]|jgi:ankyrin repeat protein|nr:ankyrin repeat protein [Rickettsiaceae bacterium]
MQEQQTLQEYYSKEVKKYWQELEERRNKTFPVLDVLQELQIMFSLEHTAEMQDFIQRNGFISLDGLFHSTRAIIIAAISKNDFAAVKFFLDHGIGANHTLWETYDNILQQACIHGSIDIVKLLVERGAYINSFNPDNGATPLSEAVRGGDNYEVIKFLLENGAILDVRTLNIKDDVNLVHYLREQNNISNDQEFDFGTISSHPELYIKHKPALIEALSNNPYYGRDFNVDTVKLLISYGANVNDQNKDGKTALNYAVEKDNMGAAILLLENGADILSLTGGPDERLHFYGIKGTLLSLADALNENKNSTELISLDSYLASQQINDKQLVSSALKGQLIVSKDAMNINNVINFIKEIAPETDINEIFNQVSALRISKIKQELIEKGILKNYQSFCNYIEGNKINIEEQNSLILEARSFIGDFNSSLYNFAHEASSLLNMTAISLIDSVAKGKFTVEELAAISINKQAFLDILDRKSLILTQVQLKVKYNLVKILQAQEPLATANKIEQNDNEQASDAKVIEDENFLLGIDADLFD